MHENPEKNKRMMSQFMENFPHRTPVYDPDKSALPWGDSNQFKPVETWNMEISPKHIADYQRSLDYSGHAIDPVDVEQDMHDQALKEAELQRVSEIAAAGKAFWDASLQGAIDLLSGGMMSTPKDEGRRKPVKMENLRGEKAGWKMAEGTNWWSVDEKDPYWQTKRGFEEAMNLYGTKPSWVKEPSLEYNPKTGKYDPIEKEEIVDLKPTKRISL